jgi:hypothetical protein
LKSPDLSEFPRLTRDFIRGSSLSVGREIVWHWKSNGGSNKCGGICVPGKPRWLYTGITRAAKGLSVVV